MKSYDHKKIEKKWQEAWAKANLYETKDDVSGQANFYLLVEFPYPSGNLHVGHWYSFAVPDILARKLRMEGKNVLYPIGFDAFGLPAENAAIKNKVNPRDWTEDNIEYMRKQIRSMGASFDWSREVVTCHPDYYKWTQWLFLQLYKSDLVYRKETMVNWCPNDKTVLANEQVVDGKCERCGHEVVQKEMLQWNIKITDYADRLVDDLEKLDWPEPIKESQRNWIGRSEGAEIDFGLDLGKKYTYLYLHGYTSRADRPRNHWYRKHLEEFGHTVVIPDLPNTDHPVEEEQVATALAATDWDEDTIVVGHSLGAIVAMKALMKSKKKIARLVLIAPAIDPAFPNAQKREFHDTFKWDIDYELIKKLAPSRLLLSDLQEPQTRIDYIRWLAPKIDAQLVETMAAKEHFTGDKEPDVLMWLRPTIRVFTTRVDTLFGATYLVLAPEHPWVTLALEHKNVLKNNDEVAKYVTQASKKTELERQQETKEKTGVKLEGVEALNPATGEKIPLFIADYVLAGYGTGAIMAVPAHDERDFEFAKKFDLPIKEVVEPLVVRTSGPDAFRTDIPGVQRVAIIAVVEHWKDPSYLCLAYSAGDAHGFVGGQIEKGETPQQAAEREIREETGYTDLEFVKELGGVVHSNFYGAFRKRNVVGHFTPLLFKLKSGARIEVSQEEASIQKVVWVDSKDMTAFINRGDFSLVLQRLQGKSWYVGEGYLTNSGNFNGMSSQEARQAMTEEFGRKKTTYRLRDWIVSRQRYWGAPIPIIHCPKCGTVPVPEGELPVLLPETDDFLPDGKGKSPLAKVKPFVNVKCPQCKGDAERETDTLDTFVDSSWYFLRYTDPKNEKEFAAKDKQANWMPIDLYSGGAEHTTMHLLYSRFWHKALFDAGLVADNEPYTRRMNRGIILGPDGQKMSKSKGNVVDPDDVVNRLGADTVRMYLAFIGPYNEVASYPWNPDGVVGVRRFIERVVRSSESVTSSESKLSPLFHRTIKKVGEDIDALKFNTAISALMILLNAMEKAGSVSRTEWNTFLTLLAPFAPHIA
ncbi:MAG TPA: alpha/beta fold hydrolase, partial [Candidatus Paceibacterota bacterium]|nr:alpha/beta fold hydrolase [Candidatus Paceibacterota bacterium]